MGERKIWKIFYGAYQNQKVTVALLVKHTQLFTWRILPQVGLLILLLILDGSPLRFKRIFGSEPQKDLLIDFLNQLFLGEKEIVDLVYNKNEYVGPLSDHRKAVFDLSCTGSNGEQFIIEVQRVKQEFFKDRCLYYTSSLIKDQIPAGIPRWDYELKPVYLICLMDFTFDDIHSDQCLHRVKLININTGDLFYDKLGFEFIEMPKFNKGEAELDSELDNWLFLLKNLGKLNKIPLFLRKPVFSKLFNIAEVSNLNREEKMAYDASLKYKWDLENSLDYALKEGFERGFRQGMEKGIEEGLEKGIEEGVGKGRHEEKLNNALAMKKRGLENNLIAEILGLSLDQVEKL